MFEERALLLSRLGRHELALAIYAHDVLKEPDMAEQYVCVCACACATWYHDVGTNLLVSGLHVHVYVLILL